MSEDLLRELQEASIEHRALLKSHDRDIHNIAKSVSSIDESVKKMTEIHASQAVQDERFTSQIRDVQNTAERAHTRIDDHDKVFKRVMWLIITPVIVALLSTVVYKSTSQTDTNKQLSELTQAIKSIKND